MMEASSDRAILLRYGEIALKGANRGWFEEHLASNACKMVSQAHGSLKVEVVREYGRMVLHAPWDALTKEALKKVFGLSNFSPIRIVPTSFETLIPAVLEELNGLSQGSGLPHRFRVLTRRPDKALGKDSMEIDRKVGSAIQAKFPNLGVDLENPELTVGIEIRFKHSYLWMEKFPGSGGLPVGTNGPVMTLISGGLDSPVAAIRILKRGSPVSFIHFHGAPFVGEDVLQKVEDLTNIVNRYQARPQPLWVVPFGKIQEKIALATHSKMRTILYRRMMIRIACRVARQAEALALVTGESLGQVASQTIENISTVNAVSDLPILRPLIAMDKEEIIGLAREWGSFDISVRPGADCCTLFADRHPVIRSQLNQVLQEESKFPVEAYVEECLSLLKKIQRLGMI